MTERTDCHRPSEIIPEDYEYVAEDYMKVEDLGSALCLQEQREIIAAHRARTGGKFASVSSGNCQVCGSVNALYTSLFYHAKTNEYVRMGHDCADKCMMSGDFGRNEFRRKVENARENQRGKNKARLILSDAGLSVAWDIYEAEFDSLPKDPKTVVDRKEILDEFGAVIQEAYQYSGSLFYEESTIRDIVNKFVKYGSISDNQMGLLRKLVERIPYRDQRRAEWEAQRAAEKAAAAPCPKGRVKIEGVVLKTETKETQWGYREVMTVKANEGYVVWGSVPSNVAVEKDCKIVFVATVEPSDTDTKFGWFRRPVLYMTKEEKAALKKAQENIQLD